MLHTLLSDLLSSDAQKVKDSQAQLVAKIDVDFRNTFFQMLTIIIDCSANHDVCLLACIIFKKKYLDTQKITQLLTPQQLKETAAALRMSIAPTDNYMALLRKKSEAIVTILTKINAKDEIVALVENLSSAGTSQMEQLAFFTFEISCEYSFDDATLLKHAAFFDKLLTQGLSSSSVDVQISAFNSIVAFLTTLTEEESLKRFQPVRDRILQNTISIIEKDQLKATQVIASLTVLIEKQPKFIKSMVQGLLEIFSEIAINNNKVFQDDIRICAMQALTSMALANAALLRKNSFFKSNTLPGLIKIASETDKLCFEEWVQETTKQKMSKNDVSSVSIEILQKLNAELGVKFMLPLLISTLGQCLAREEPNCRSAGLMAMAVLTQGSSEYFKKDIDNILTMLEPTINFIKGGELTKNNEQQIRLLYDLVELLTCLGEEFQPQFQEKHGDKILMISELCLKSQLTKLNITGLECVISCCRGFTNKLEEEQTINPPTAFTEKLNSMVQEVSRLFNKALKPVCFELLKISIDTIAAMAPLYSKDFAKYYEYFMPGLRSFLATLSDTDPKDITLRTSTIECMGQLLGSLSQDQSNVLKFEKDLKQLMEGLFAVANNAQTDDPFLPALLKFSGNIVCCVKYQQFEQFLPRIFKLVEKAVNITVECKLVDVLPTAKPVEVDTKKKYLQKTLDLGMFGGSKNFILNTAALQIKIEGAHLFYQMAVCLDLAFENYVPASLEIICQHISFKNSQDIRFCMINSVAPLVKRCCSSDDQRRFFVKVFWKYFEKHIIETIQRKDHQQLSLLLEVLSEVQAYLNEECVQILPSMLQNCVQAIKVMSKDVEESYDGDRDEHAEEELAEQIAEVQEGLGFVLDIVKGPHHNQKLAAVLKHFPKDYELE